MLIKENWMNTCLEWGLWIMCVFVINVYSKCTLIDKRALWFKFNNVNSRLFHAFVRCRSRRNVILALRLVRLGSKAFMISDKRLWNTSQLCLENQIQIDLVRMELSSNLSRKMIILLYRLHLFFKSLIWLSQSERDKRPGPNGFNFSFLKNSWTFLDFT